MNDLLTFSIGGRIKSVDYKSLVPYSVAKIHCEYIRQAQSLQLKSPSSLFTEATMIRHLFHYLESRHLIGLSLFTLTQMQEFHTYLRTLTSKTGKPLSKSSQRLAYTFFKNFSLWLQEYHPKESPPLNIFQRSPYKGNNDHLKTHYFSDHVLEQIKKAIVIETDIYTKTYLLISLYYGLRSLDTISLNADCLIPSDKDGKYDLRYIDHKQKEVVIIPAIASPVARAIQSLIEHTAPLRTNNNIEALFIDTHSNGSVIKLNSYQKTRLDRFTKTHNITDESGNTAKITSHMFRRTLATNLQSSGASLEATQVIMNHKHKRTTLKHYIKTKSEDYIDQISKTLDHMQVLSSAQEIEQFHQEHTGVTLRLSDGYCTNVSMMNDAAYMCDNFPKRGNCYGCSKMVTTPEFLPYFKQLITDKDKELKSKSIYGSHVIRQLEFEKGLIETIIDKLEVMS